jgi:hypothetical protein
MPKDHTLVLVLILVDGCVIVWWVRPYIASDVAFAMVISIFLFVHHKTNFENLLER